MKGKAVDPKIRARALARYRAGKESATEIAEDLGFAVTSLYRWLKREAGDGAAAGSDPVKRTANNKVLAESRTAVVEAALTSEEKTAALAKRYGVSIGALHRWLLGHYQQHPGETRLPHFKRRGSPVVEEIHARVLAAQKRSGKADAEPATPQEQSPQAPRSETESAARTSPPRRLPAALARVSLSAGTEQYRPPTEVEILRETLREALEERAALRLMVDILTNEISTLKGQRQ